jgi:hypothetical protein
VKDRTFFTALKRRNVYKLAIPFMACGKASLLFEITLVLVCLDHVASVIVTL